MIVTKFGGSSLASATQLKKVKNIISANPDRQVVVVSAPGKRDSSDYKITDLLYTLRSHFKYGIPDDGIREMIIERYTKIKEELDLDIDIEKEINEFFKSCSKKTNTATVVSRGEYFSAKLVAKFLGFSFVDAADILTFNFDGKIDYEKSKQAVIEAIDKYGNIVVPGFYGAYPDGDIHLLSRGGSDVTGAWLAAFLDADVYENWTDVSGIYAADPRIARGARTIKTITYEELREMSYMGANVLHEDSILPCQKADIPINILNTNDPENSGTIITSEAVHLHPITGIAGKQGYVSFIVNKEHIAGEVGFIYRLLSIFNKYDVSVEHIPTGMDTVSIVTYSDEVKNCTHKIVADIANEFDCEVYVERDIALIALVGRQMQGSVGISAKIFEILRDENINVKMMVQTPDEMTLVVGVDDEDSTTAIAALYEGLSEANLL